MAAPEAYQLDEATVAFAHAVRDAGGGSLALTDDADEAARGAHALATDAFVSMGQEVETAERLDALMPGYRVDERRVSLLAGDGVVLHCLPAHYGQEIDESVLYGPRSAVWDQAENRLHAQKALVAALLGLLAQLDPGVGVQRAGLSDAAEPSPAEPPRDAGGARDEVERHDERAGLAVERECDEDAPRQLDTTDSEDDLGPPPAGAPAHARARGAASG